MERPSPSQRRLIGVGILVGALLNPLGWVGNVFLLGDMWETAISAVPVTAWRETVWKEALSFAPDFIYGAAWVWLYAALRSSRGPGLGTALVTGAWVFVVGVFTTYLGTANAGLLPWGISAATTAWAAATFVLVAWVLVRALEPRSAV